MHKAQPETIAISAGWLSFMGSRKGRRYGKGFLFFLFFLSNRFTKSFFPDRSGTLFDEPS